MKNLPYFILIILALSALSACKAKGSRINPLDTNTFDSVAVGPPLVVDTDIVGTTNTGALQPSPYDKADSMVDKDIDTTGIDTGTTSLP